MKIKHINAVLIILVLVFGWMAFSSKDIAETSVKKSYISSVLSATSNITCTYSQMLHASTQSGEITHELPKPETNPIIMTFSDVNSSVVTIKFIDATQTISEVSAVKLLDTEDKLIFIEGDGTQYMTTHTIYKDSGTATYSKQMSILGVQMSTMSMGTCVEY
jgi:hypothetical protein